MIQKMAENGMLAEINYDNIPNIKNIVPEYMEKAESLILATGTRFPTPGHSRHPLQYEAGGGAGLNPPAKWADLWNPAYQGEILMQDSVRDAFMVALKSLGYSLNSTSEAELKEARDLLIAQKPLVQAYVIDQVRDKMIGGEAAAGVIYSGEMLFIQEEAADRIWTISWNT